MIATIFVLITAGLLWASSKALQRRRHFLCGALAILALIPSALAVLSVAPK